VTTNRICQHWASIFDQDAVLTSALPDRLQHDAETVLVEGKSYRFLDQVEVRARA
jgi:DNA replication protein DnaC